MSLIPPSGYYYPNKFGLLVISALKDVMGQNGIDAILTLAKLEEMIDDYPPSNLDKAFDFASLSSILIALEEMYGGRGGRGLASRAGKALFANGLKDFGTVAGVGDLALRVLPLNLKVKIGLPAFATIFNQISDQQVEVQQDDDDFLWNITRCPVCWGRTDAAKPVCHLAAGLLEESLRWVSGGREFTVVEEKCHACGDGVCQFRISEQQ
jgi:predicted hydrocarbon binding protein